MMKFILANAVLAFLATALLAQNPTPDRTLVVNGKQVGATMIQRNGREYVDVQALVQALGGSVTFQSNQVVVSVSQRPASSETTVALSKEFQWASVAALGDMRQWVGAISALTSSGFVVASTWPQDYQHRVDRDFADLTVAASTNGDRQALQLMQNLRSVLGKWADTVVTQRNDLNAARSVDPNALQNDPVLAQIVQCGQFLSSMIVRGTFADDSSCH
jgi:hypothetical protein